MYPKFLRAQSRNAERSLARNAGTAGTGGWAGTGMESESPCHSLSGHRGDARRGGVQEGSLWRS